MGRLRRIGAEGCALARMDASELTLAQVEAARPEWARLAARALEPNAFFEPGFLLAAARHFPHAQHPRFVALRGPEGELCGLFPVAGASAADGFLRLWRSDWSALATPLVDPARPAETIAAFLDWAEAESDAAGVLFPRLSAGGAFHAALTEATRGRRQIALVEAHARAALAAGGSADDTLARAGGRKRVNEIRRARRRLEEMGAVVVEVASTPAALRTAAEAFLALEGAGWKAGRGALLSDPALATFLRSATRQLAEDGLCRIVALRLDGRPIAMAILFDSQNHSYCWKIAFDEGFRAQAPGVQLIYEVTRLQLARPEIALTDSCAIANHPMIDRLWPDRVEICDLAVATRASAFDAALRAEQTRRRARAFAKRAAALLIKRKVS